MPTLIPKAVHHHKDLSPGRFRQAVPTASACQQFHEALQEAPLSAKPGFALDILV